MLDTLSIRYGYRGAKADTICSFYKKCLTHSSLFSRSVAYFNSSCFRNYIREFSKFFNNGGEFRLITSGNLSSSDIYAIRRGYTDKYEFINKQYRDNIGSKNRKSIREMLSILIAKERINVKIATLRDNRKNYLYHEKMGFFEDSVGNIVSFTGSANETLGGIEKNFESMEVYCSWKNNDRKRSIRKKREFEEMWEGDRNDLIVEEFLEALSNGRLKKYSPQQTHLNTSDIFAMEKEDSGTTETLRIPSNISLYEHQKEAVKKWLNNNGQGILEMATGSGKTIAALACATKLYELIGPPIFIVVVCPYLHLVEQWEDEMKKFYLRPIKCAYGKNEWYDKFQTKLFSSRVEVSEISSCVVTNKTFQQDYFQNLVDNIDIPLLIIGDEVHNLGSKSASSSLPKNADYRLGLSATPERWFDPSGTDKLFSYFGDPMVHYGLGDSLEDEVICPYNYFPVKVTLTPEEIEEYSSISADIAKGFSAADSLSDPPPALKRLLIKRARLVATAENKIDALRSAIVESGHEKFNLIYCGDGRVEEPGSDQETRQIRAVSKLLGKDLGMRVATYTYETPPARRRDLEERFAEGELECLIAIRCLDEGVDIPEIENAFILASSSNPRQFIQRRGRLLRKSPGKEIANIYDFVVIPPEAVRDAESSHFAVSRNLFKKELRRIYEFANLAQNGPQALERLLNIRDELQLLDFTP